jgi:hypothetical protein
MATLERMDKFEVFCDNSARNRLLAMLMAALTITAAACGVKLEADQTTTEIFRSVSVTDSEGNPELPAGETIVLHVEYTQYYPSQLDIECDLLSADESTKVSDIHVAVAPPNAPENIPTSIQENFRDEVTPIAGRFDQSFFAPAEPGQYVVRCFTQEDDNNEVERTILIGPAPTPTPEAPA